MTKTYSIKEIMERYVCSEHTVLRWINNNELKAINVARVRGTRPRYRVTEEALLAFEISRMSSKPPEQQRNKKSTTDVVEFY
jgi:transposase